jgi:hypothetical protein
MQGWRHGLSCRAPGYQLYWFKPQYHTNKSKSKSLIHRSREKTWLTRKRGKEIVVKMHRFWFCKINKL